MGVNFPVEKAGKFVEGLLTFCIQKSSSEIIVGDECFIDEFHHAKCNRDLHVPADCTRGSRVGSS